jgi:hypothetical protein
MLSVSIQGDPVRRFAFSAAAVMSIATCAVVVGPSVAPAYANCGTGLSYDITGHSTQFLPAPGIHYKDGPGGTMKVSVEKSTSISTSVTATVEVSVSDLISSVKGTVSGTAERTDGITTGHEYDHNVPAHKFGNLEYGSFGYYVHFNKVRTQAPCKVSVVGHGTATVPTNAEGWHYWSTRH